MQTHRTSAPSHLVLLGGGHANAQVLVALATSRVDGLRITLVSDVLATPYSGMLPGCIAGDYAPSEMLIDLPALARQSGAVFVHARAVAVDAVQQRLLLEHLDGSDRCEDLPFDVLSINVGIVPHWTTIAGAEEHAIPVKPIVRFTPCFDALRERVGKSPSRMRIAMVGGGPAGVELAFAVSERLRKERVETGFNAGDVQTVLVSAGAVVSNLNAGSQRRVRQALARAGIDVIEGERVSGIAPGHIICESGRRIDADAALISTHARLPDWLGHSHLRRAETGGIAVRNTLQTLTSDAIFAAGDCASIVGHPRPRAGVYAVRQGPVLARNLLAFLTGAPLEAYRPQRDALVLLRISPGCAIAARGRWLSAEGWVVHAWKTAIDRRFMNKFRVDSSVGGTGHPNA
jgi:selenide,water dikinase